MGAMCCPSLGSGESETTLQPDIEARRRQQAEAAERRQKEAERRGVKNPESVRRKQERQRAIDEQPTYTRGQGGGGLQWKTDLS